ncbi:MAG: hypothetical protein ACFFCO_12800, partial [Promethearchaeota archaeon]
NLVYQYYENGDWSEATLVFSTQNYAGPARRDIGPSQIACYNNGTVAVGWLDEGWYYYNWYSAAEWYSDDFIEIWNANYGIMWYSILNSTGWSDPTYFSFTPVRCDYKFQYLQNGSLFVIWVEIDEELHTPNWNLHCSSLDHSSGLSVLAYSSNDQKVPWDFQLLEGEEGQLYALWSYNYSLYYRVFDDASWSNATSFSFGREQLHDFKAAVDSAGTIHLATHMYGGATGDYPYYIAYLSLFENSLSPITIVSSDVDDEPYLRFDVDSEDNLHLMWKEHHQNGGGMYSCRRIGSVWQTPQLIDTLSWRVSGLAMVNASVSYALDAEFFGRTKILKHYLVGSDWAQPLSILASGIPDFEAQLHWHIFWKSLLLFVGVSFTFPLAILLLRRRISALLPS